MAELPKRVFGPGQSAKTRGLWVDSSGQKRSLMSGEHEPEFREAQAHAERLGLVREPYKLATAADIELKFAMRMQREGITHARIVLNNRPCPGRLGCDELLPKFLEAGSTLTVHGPDGFKKTYKGEAR
ncbi:MAG: DddA-like double-stranded DNA deaminase toxin [Micromonosporaceae bacterium]